MKSNKEIELKRKQRLKSYYKHREAINLKRKEEYKENPEKAKELNKKYYLNNKTKVSERIKIYRKTYPEVLRKAVKKWIEQNPEKTYAHQELYKAIKRGEKLPAKMNNCLFEGCKDKAKHYHHEDYSKPLEVIPLCAKHHKEVHNA